MEYDQNGNPMGTGQAESTPAPEMTAPQQPVQQEAAPETAPQEQPVDELDIGALFDRADELAGESTSGQAPETEQPVPQQSEQQGIPQTDPQQVVLTPIQQPAEQPGQPQQTYKVVVAGQEQTLTQEQLNQIVEQNHNYSSRVQQLEAIAGQMQVDSVQPFANGWGGNPAYPQQAGFNPQVPQQQFQQPQYPGQMPGHGYDQVPGQYPNQMQQEPPLPDDPVEAIVEQATRNAVNAMQHQQQEQARVQQSQTYAAKVSNAQRMVAADDMRGEVMAELSKIAPVGSALRAQFNSDPSVFFPTYAQTRARLAAARQTQQPRTPQAQVPAGGGQQGAKQGQDMPQTRSVTAVAPVLEGGGGEVPLQQADMKARAAAVREKAYGGDLHAAGQLFDFQEG